MRGVVRTRNNPVGDYTEWLVARALGLTLSANAASGHDAMDADGLRFQIKGRRISRTNQSRQLGVIRNYAQGEFDYLAGVIFDENYQVIEALLVPHAVVSEYAGYRQHVNGHVLQLKGAITRDPRVQSIRDVLIQKPAGLPQS